jgi:serine protease Do
MFAIIASATLAMGQQVPRRDRSVTEAATPQIGHAEILSQAFRQAANDVLPTVVQIKSTIRARQVMRRSSRGGPLDDFFGQGMIPEQEGTGSGVIIRSEGLILTNNHVVQNADQVTVVMADGREYRATDVRSDPLTDIALVWIEGNEPFPAARLGDSDQLQIGDWVLAVGHPFELGSSVSAGIVSAKGRSISAANRASFLQTDAAVNPGNSGGPLVNLHGEVVGINTAIATRSGGYQGISFAVPVNLVKWVIEQLIREGAVHRAYLGVGIAALTPEVRQVLELPPGLEGVQLTLVESDSPADQAGLEPGDVITHFDGRPIASPADLQRMVERLPAGSRHTAQLLRGGRRVTAEVVLDGFPVQVADRRPERGSRRPEDLPLPQQESLGLQVDELSPEIARQLGFESYEGVLVTGVSPQGMAAQAGLRAGILIIRVGDQAVGSVDELAEALRQAPLERGVFLEGVIPRLDGQRQGRQLFLLKQS